MELTPCATVQSERMTKKTLKIGLSFVVFGCTDLFAALVSFCVSVSEKHNPKREMQHKKEGSIQLIEVHV